MIEAYSKQDDEKIVDLFSSLMVDCGWEKEIEKAGDTDAYNNYSELKDIIFEFEKTYGEDTNLEKYLEEVALVSQNDAESKGKVKLMTAHGAKGLEFPYVFMFQMNEGDFPSSKAADYISMEEERRLAYVAMTRAEKELYLTLAEKYSDEGTNMHPSRFVLDIDEDLIDFTAPLSEEYTVHRELYLKERDYKKEQQELKVEIQKRRKAWDVGGRVKHKHFGYGVITKIDNKALRVTIKFDDYDVEKELVLDTDSLKLE